MADFIYGVDAHYWPIVIGETNKTIIIEETGADPVAVDIPEGRYWAHTEAGLTDYPSLYEAIEGALNGTSALSGSYTIAESTPAGSALQNSGIHITGGSTEFVLRVTNVDWTFDQRLLGIAEGATTDEWSGGIDDHTWYSPLSIWGVWQSYNLQDGAASNKTDDPFTKTELSTDDVSRARAQEYFKRTDRTYVYEWVPGAHVRYNRARDAASAKTADLPQGDVHNAFEAFHDGAATPGASDRLARVLVVHDEGDEDHYITSHPYEVYRLKTLSQIQRPSECWDVMRMAGELYRLEWDTRIIEGTYDQ